MDFIRSRCFDRSLSGTDLDIDGRTDDPLTLMESQAIAYESALAGEWYLRGMRSSERNEGSG